MTADDQTIIGYYSDGELFPAARASKVLGRTPAAISIRAGKLRKLGLIGDAWPLPAESAVAPSPTPERPPRAIEEHPIRCPGCMKVFFPSDALPFRATA